MAERKPIDGSIASQLPQELMLNIFHRLTVSDIKICRCVCRSWAWSASVLLSDLTFLNFKVALKDTTTLDFLSTLSITTFKSLKLRKISIAFSSDAMAATWLWGPVITASNSLTLEKCSITERDFVRVLTHCLGKTNRDDLSQHVNFYSISDSTNDTRGHKSANNELKSTSNLRHLALIDCRDLFMSGGLMDQPSDLIVASLVLSNVTTLDISRNTYMTDVMFQRLIRCMPELETLILNETNIQHHPGIYKKFYPEHVIQGSADSPDEEVKNSRIFNSPSIFTFGCLLQYLKSQSIKITALGLQGTNLPDGMIQEISNIPGLKLKSLDISRNPGIKQGGMMHLTESQSCHLQELDFSFCRRVTMDYTSYLPLIFENLSNLTKLVIQGISCTRGFDECLLFLTHLEHLDITDCDIPARHLADGIIKPLEEASSLTASFPSSEVNTDNRSNIEEGMTNRESGNDTYIHDKYSIMKKAEQRCCARKLKVLIFSKYLRAPEHIARILKWTTNLRRLNFNGCTLSQDAMAQLFQSLNSSGLNDLNLNKCEESGGLDPRCQLLEPKELKMPEEVTYKVIKERLNGSISGGNVNLRSKFGNIGDLKALTVLKISENLVTDSTIINAFHFFDLRIIDVSGCENITSNGFIALAYQNTHIEYLIAKSCKGLDDVGVIAIACCLKRLVHLDIESCYNVTSTALALTSGCDALVGFPPNTHWSPNTKGLSGCKLLRFLNISKCPEINIVAVDALLDILGPSLRVKIDEAPNVSNRNYLEAFP